MTKVNELEKLAESVNLKYRKSKKALILKVPTPILYTAKGLIAQQSTVDYTGLLSDGTFIAYDAKETESKTSFPLANIHGHQLVFLEIVQELSGLGFFLIHFKKVYADKAFITPIKIVQKYWHGDGRKSIPLSDFKDSWLTPITSYIDKVIEIKNEIRGL